MTNCTDCRYQENMCKWPCDDCVKGDKWEERPLTNADRIRTMTDEELAEYLCLVENADSYVFEWLYWLKQEVNNGD